MKSKINYNDLDKLVDEHIPVPFFKFYFPDVKKRRGFVNFIWISFAAITFLFGVGFAIWPQFLKIEFASFIILFVLFFIIMTIWEWRVQQAKDKSLANRGFMVIRSTKTALLFGALARMYLVRSKDFSVKTLWNGGKK
jgi:hypothetical protein